MLFYKLRPVLQTFEIFACSLGGEGTSTTIKLFNIFFANSTLSTQQTFTFKVNEVNTRKRSEICSNVTIETPERRRPCVFTRIYIVDFD